jgi:hypothetical protein
MPEIRTSIDMMSFALRSVDKFKDKRNLIPFMIAIMKITGALATEAINLLKMGQSSTVQDIVKDFIAFGIIAEIDDLIVHTIKGVDIEALMSSKSTAITFSVKKSKEKNFVTSFKDIFKVKYEATLIKSAKKLLYAISNFLFFGVYKIVKLAYIGFYFYFGPLLIIILVTAYGD